MADLLSTSIAGTLNVSQGASITGNLFVSNTDIVPEIVKYSRALSNLNYDSVQSWYSTKQTLDVNPYGTTPQGIYVKPDGTQLYVLDDTQDNVSQFRLTSAHNVASAVYEGNLRITSADGLGVDLFFSNTGTVLYILGDSGNAIDAYDLPTAWNVVAGTTGANTVVAGNTLTLYSSVWTGMHISSNGAFLYLSNDPSVTNAHIVQYNVASAWNLATSTLSSTLNVEPFGISSPTSVSMNKTGTKMYVINDGGSYDQYIYQFDLTQPYQLITATYSGKSHVWGIFNDATSNPEVNPTALFYDADSNTAYSTGTNADTIRTAKTGFGTYIPTSIIVDGKILANNGLDVAEGRATTLGGALYVASTSQFWSALAITGTLTGAAATFSGVFTHTSSTGNYGSAIGNATYRLGYGATTAGSLKTIEIGMNGLAGSNTDITIGTNAGGNSNVTMYGNTTISGNLFVRGIDITASLGGGSGAQGVQGAVGAQGIQGVQGLAGPQGVQGLEGAQGVQGAVGAQGVQGLAGPQGVQGLEGAQGVQGLIGIQGVQGLEGAQGVQGAVGAQGVQGLIGIQGVQGFIGIQGVQGVQGSLGAQGSAGGIGLRTIWIPAQTMLPRTTNGAGTTITESATNRVMVKSLDFDPTTQEFAQFSIRMPKSWNEGTVTYSVAWTAASGTASQGVVWSLSGVSLSDTDAIDTAFGTAINVTDTLTTLNDIHIAPTSAAVTIAGTPLAGDITFFQIARAPADGSDTLTGDARLVGVTLFATADAQDDT